MREEQHLRRLRRLHRPAHFLCQGALQLHVAHLLCTAPLAAGRVQAVDRAAAADDLQHRHRLAAHGDDHGARGLPEQAVPRLLHTLSMYAAAHASRRPGTRTLGHLWPTPHLGSPLRARSLPRRHVHARGPRRQPRRQPQGRKPGVHRLCDSASVWWRPRPHSECHGARARRRQRQHVECAGKGACARREVAMPRTPSLTPPDRTRWYSVRGYAARAPMLMRHGVRRVLSAHRSRGRHASAGASRFAAARRSRSRRMR